MSDLAATTGLERLDSDLRALFDANSPKRRQEIKAAISDKSLTAKQLFDAVPMSIYRLAEARSSADSWKSVLEIVKEDARPLLEKAAEIINEHFADIVNHPALEDEEDQDSELDFLNIVAAMSHMPSWMGSPPTLRPNARVVFRGDDGRLLFDTTCTWSDYAYMAKTFTEFLVCEMKSGAGLAEKGLIDLPNKKLFAKRLRSLAKNVEKINQLISVYGVSVDEGKERATKGKPATD